jgi:CRISPR system Cascade subunit CasB
MPEAVQTKDGDLKSSVAGLVGAMTRLEPGSLARLRRMDIDGPGELEFWRLARDFNIRGDATGMQFIRILALLAPRGDPGARGRFHALDHALGEVLARSGFSERRLASFMALPFTRRGEALESMARFIARKMEKGVNCVDIGHLLFVNDVWPLRRLASNYYNTFDRIAADQTKGEDK